MDREVKPGIFQVGRPCWPIWNRTGSLTLRHWSSRGKRTLMSVKVEVRMRWPKRLESRHHRGGGPVSGALLCQWHLLFATLWHWMLESAAHLKRICLPCQSSVKALLRQVPLMMQWPPGFCLNKYQSSIFNRLTSSNCADRDASAYGAAKMQ